MRLRYWIILSLVAATAALILCEVSIYKAIRRQAAHDEAQPAGAIVVFGAAEYNGRPSPVYKARLDHAFDLEEQHFAPLVITTGGSGGDPHYTEGGVGADYLIQQGVAARKILTETHADTTYQSVSAVVRMLRKRGIRTCIAVSDGFHLYRIKLMFSSFGINAFGSPAPASPIEADPFARNLFSVREMLIITLWHLGLHV
ncbi:MAG: YdcF family protein [Acidobacteria bacterium]|nr:YdcF family protein [Acidobacteriota bacterium]